MPLISNSKSIYVGNTPITTVMAGEKLVWSSTTLSNFNMYYQTPDPDINSRQTQWVYASWECNKRWPDCDSVVNPNWFGLWHKEGGGNWVKARWDSSYINCLPASNPKLMAMQVFHTIAFEDRRCKISYGNPFNPSETYVYTDEIVFSGDRSSNPNYDTFPAFPLELYYDCCQGYQPKESLTAAQWWLGGVLYAGAFFNCGIKGFSGPPCATLTSRYQQRLVRQGQAAPAWQNFTGNYDRGGSPGFTETMCYMPAGTSATVHASPCTFEMRKVINGEVIWQDSVPLTSSDLVYSFSNYGSCP